MYLLSNNFSSDLNGELRLQHIPSLSTLLFFPEIALLIIQNVPQTANCGIAVHIAADVEKFL